MKTVRLGDVVSQPWRNGGGTTRELLAWPAGDAWRLRLSVADVERDGPFSAYPGVERWFVVLEGAGIALGLPGGERHVVAGDAPLHFDGADAPACRLVGGPTRDLNLMLRGIDGGLVPVAAGAWTAAAPRSGLFALDAGRWRCDDGAAAAVEAMSLLWLDPAPRRPQQFDGRGWWVRCGEETAP